MAAAEADTKARLVDGLLEALAPATLLDLGSNTGQYAIMAARRGARVVALDQDEASIAALYGAARRAGLDLLPLVMDLGNPSPGGGWCAEQRPDALTRFRSEACLMLALIHHLVYTANVGLAQIARLAERACTRVAIVEWVAPEDPMSEALRRTATKDFGFYTLDGLCAAFAEAGFAVRRLEPHAPTRQLLVCERAR
jgi:SAM-dependent methyltransferase